MNKNCRKLQILIGIIPTFSENFNQIDQVWPQLQPKTWSEAIDKLDIQLGAISPFNQDWISRQSMTAFKMHFWRLSIIKWCTLLYILRMASDHVLGCSWGHTWLIWMKFSENVGIIPIKICNFLQFLFSWTHEPQIQIQIVWKLCCHPVVGKNATNNFWKIFESSGHSAYTFKPPRNVICKNVIYSKKK